MPAPKVDFVIEAVRYSPSGEIHTVRGYLRRGAAYSDRVLLSRAELLRMLEDGKRVMTGERIPQLGGCFRFERKVKHFMTQDKRPVISTQPAADQDQLEDTPLF